MTPYLPTELGVLGTTSATIYFSDLDSHPNDINDSDTIVGNSGYGRPYHPENNSSDETKAVLWDKNGDLYDLNLLLESSQQSEWVLNDAIAINNSGVILARGTFNGATYFAVLEPQDPSTVESANRPVVDFPCNIGADPQTIRAGENVPLWWWTDEEENGFFPIINNGIGILDNFAGYQSVSPTETTTYKMSARRKGNKIATCETTIVVEDDVKPTSPHCDMGADPQTIRAGEGVPLWWWTQDTTLFPSIDNEIGQVDSFAGYKWVYPSKTTTYTMAVESEQGATATCETTIVVDGEVKPVSPLCDIGADPQSINVGDRVPLWWWFEEEVTTATIDNGIGSISDLKDYQWVDPVETTTYTLTVENERGIQGTCETTIVVN